MGAASLVMFLNLGLAFHEAPERLPELGPVTLMVLSLTHLVTRVPFKRYRHRELPLIVLSVAMAFAGGLLFRPYEEVPDEGWGFQLFFASFFGLAVLYGFFCTAVPEEHCLRREVIEPVKTCSHIGLPGLDIGLVLAPFLFPYFLVRFWLRSRKG